MITMMEKRHQQRGQASLVCWPPSTPPSTSSQKGVTSSLSKSLVTQKPRKINDFQGYVACYGYRYYDPNLGRWLSKDPIGEEGGLNLYGFLGNDGVGYFDYLGMYLYDPGIDDYSKGWDGTADLVDATNIKDGEPCPECCVTCKGVGDARPVIVDNGTSGHVLRAKVVSPKFYDICKGDGKCGGCCAARYYWYTCYYKKCHTNKKMDFTKTVIPVDGAPAWRGVSVAIQSWKICKCESGKWSCKIGDKLKDMASIGYKIDQTENLSTANWYHRKRR